MEITLYRGLADLPVFSPDREGANTPIEVHEFFDALRQADGVIISSPEYVRGIPGGLKNAIDWLVSGEEVIGKPIVLTHASHRGDDMLAALRLVLGTVTQRFCVDIFLQLPLMSKNPEEVREFLRGQGYAQKIGLFLSEFVQEIGKGPASAR